MEKTDCSCTPRICRRGGSKNVVVWHGERGLRQLNLDKLDLKNIKAIWDRATADHGACWKVNQPFVESTVWVVVLKRIFAAKPTFKIPLGLEDVEPADLLGDYRFRWHCRNFAMFWYQIISTLISKNGNRAEIEEEAVSEINRIGLRHSRNPLVSFDAEAWMLFKTALLEGFCGKLSDQTDDSWRSLNKVLIFVIGEIKGSFLAEISTKRSSQLSITVLSEPPDESDEQSDDRGSIPASAPPLAPVFSNEKS